VREGIVWAGMKYRHGLAFYDGRDWRTLSGAVLPAVHNHEYSSCDFVMDITATRTGSLLVLNPIGVFEYTGVDS
jgi:hypothetical protein